ncbi:MAG: polysaccharide deacetylase family protein, partial [Bacillota bacterium]|nr:polysaccharide deacetylase family protein [Bacillota bacterium]
MKRVIALALAIALVVTWAGAANAQALSVLKLGAKGPEVERLQRALTALGHPVKADGVYGQKTGAAVRKVQASSGLKQDGLVGKSTWNAINSALALQQMIRQGIYIVQRGDTLPSIAARLKVSQASLIEANSLVPGRMLFAGQALSIPSKSEQARTVTRPSWEPVLAGPARQVALTFDDTPSAACLRDVLRLLDVRNIKATFFLTHATLLEYKQDLQEAARAGHTIENHGGATGNSSGASVISADISAVASVIERVSGRRSTFFRPLSAAVPAPFAEAAALAGHTVVMWSNIGRPDDDLLLQAT